DEKDDRGALNSNLGLLKDALGNLGFFARKDATRIHNFVGKAAPTDNPVDSISCNTRLIGNDRSPLANEPIEQSGFSHVWSPDNGDERQCGRHEVLRW